MSTAFRFCIPQRITQRGAGLGNELHGYAKVCLAAGELRARSLLPAWGRNPRGYWRYFKSSRLDWLYQTLLVSALPTYVFDEEQYLATGEHDFRRAVRAYADHHGLDSRSAFAFVTGGMWGGMSILRPAFPFVRRMLYSATGTAKNLSDLDQRIPEGRLVISIHVRRGEFASQLPNNDVPAWAQWNWALPLDWYIAVCRSIEDQLDVPHSFVLFTDGTPDEVRPLIAEIEPITLFDQRMSVCSDLLAMASADLLICSRSSFSIWAAALSSKPYVWPAESLYRTSEYLAIWDHGEPPVADAEDSSRQLPRGIPIDSSGVVPLDLITYLESVHSRKALTSDLVFYGRIPRSN